MLRPFVVIAIIFLGFGIFSCSPPELKKTSPEVNTVKSGEEFIIVLPESHTKSLIWKLIDGELKSLEYITSVWHGEEKGVYYHFRALKPGVDTITFSLHEFNEFKKDQTYIIYVN